MLTRRSLLLTPLLLPASAAYAVGVEPMVTDVTRYRVAPPAWPKDLQLKVAVVADIHACDPWMSVPRIERIVHDTNALGADLIVLLGDYVAGHDKVTSFVPNADWARALAGLRAPLGVFAILGNHDWWADKEAQARGGGPIAARKALEKAGVPVLENDSLLLTKGGRKFWVAGLGDQQALQRPRPAGGTFKRGVDDLDKTLDVVPHDAPVILLIHEPDIFP